MLAAAFLITAQPGQTTSTRTAQSSSTSTSTASVESNASGSLKLELSVNPAPNGTLGIYVDEYNSLQGLNNASASTDWPVTGLSMGACGTGDLPFGVAMYRGTYITQNVSGGQQLRIFPVVPCPLFLRLVTGYLFQPTSDLAVILPGGSNATSVAIAAKVNVTSLYPSGVSVGSTTSPTPLQPGPYTVAAGDEWGSLVLLHFVMGANGSLTVTTTIAGSSATGTLLAAFDVGPTQPVCSASSSMGPAPSQYSSIQAVLTPPLGEGQTHYVVSWVSDGCNVSGTFQASLFPGNYSLSLSPCQFPGCSSSLPKSFTIVANQTTQLNVTIDTGIR